MWSKIKLGEELTEDRIREKLQMRLETIIPFIKIDIIFIVQGKWSKDFVFAYSGHYLTIFYTNQIN